MTQAQDIERMAKDVFTQASPADEWDTAATTRRNFCYGMATHLSNLGYKPSIVHGCCETAQYADTAIKASKRETWANGYRTGEADHCTPGNCTAEHGDNRRPNPHQ